MKKYITLAALLVAGSAFANAWHIDAEFTDVPVKAGDFWSDDYEFTFTLEDLTDLSDSQIVLAFYRGSAINDTYGYNAIVLNSTKSENDISWFLTVGRGRAYDTENEGTGITSATTFTFAHEATDKVTFTTEIELNVEYTLSVTGGNQAMTPTLTWEGGSEVLDSYKGNMNGNADLTYAVIPPIPEPSAFGLLAGLGALALVGTRRRRR